MFGEILPRGGNPDSVKPASANNTQTHARTRENIRSRDPVQAFALPSLHAALHPESPREPRLISGEDGEEEG